MKIGQEKYEEWLSCIANTRFLFNTIAELEEFLEAPSIHSNGIKRCFSSLQRLRSAFRDLHCEIADQTKDECDLKSILEDYKKAWYFFRDNLARRTDPFMVALELLQFTYPPYNISKLGKKKIGIFNEIEQQGINIPFTILMLLKIIPGYDSKNGDVADIDTHFANALALLEKFTEGSEFFSTLPAIIAAREEPNKTRFRLFYHITNILNTYASYAEQENIYGTSNQIKNSYVDLDIDGFWNECDGKLSHTSFWHITRAKDAGSYFAYHWQKDADNNLTGICYTLFLINDGDGRLTAYMQHPEGMKHRMQGLPYTDHDHVWYKTDMPTDDAPNKLPFNRYMASQCWQKSLNLTRVTDQNLWAIYQKWLSTCYIVKPFSCYEYEFYPNLYAITPNYIYIPTEDNKQLYQVPKSEIEGLDQIQIDDNVGLMKMNGKYFLAFDELLLYLPTTKGELQKHGIKLVDNVE